MLQLVLHCVIFSVICSNQLFHPYLNQIYEAPFKLIALVCLMSLATEYFIVWSKEKLKLKMYFHICCYRVVNNNLKSFWVSLNFLFTNKQVNPNNLSLCFWGHFFGCPYQSTGMKFTLDTTLVFLKLELVRLQWIHRD